MEYKNGMRLRATKQPDMGEATVICFADSHMMWVLEFDEPKPSHRFWPTHTCHGATPSGGGRYFYGDELDKWFELAGPKVRKLTGFARFVLDKSL